ncbi:CKLF-like MARVEL transmembrane domain-containing protein 3 isoform X2 [Latimeria chalumnae]|uniref:CKLF-like MARVEL transmembrane domain-containing protein 3 isoform X2 n=1 Tax=Latimeria chalumnae TaxID=7897 RepID=UPI00313D9B9A
MEDLDSPSPAAAQTGLGALLPTKAFLTSRKGILLSAEVVLSFLTFICYIASIPVSFMTAPLLEFLFALFIFYAYSSKLNEKFTGVHWPLMDFLRCVSAAIIYFVISIIAISQRSDGAAKAAGVFGFIATIVFALDFYIIFNDLANFLRQGNSANTPEASKSRDEDSDSDED